MRTDADPVEHLFELAPLVDHLRHGETYQCKYCARVLTKTNVYTRCYARQTGTNIALERDEYRT